MAKVLVTESYLSGIANAIRGKNGQATTYKPSEMAAAITNLPTGITPTGTKNITQNGTVDVTNYASAAVSVLPNLQQKTATQNGEVTPDSGYDGLSKVTVNVSGGGSLDKTKQNFTLAGNCYVKSGFVTGFTSQISLFQPKDSLNNDLVVDWSKAFKIHTRIKLSNTYNGSQALYGANASSVYFVLPSCEIRTTDGFWFGFTTNGTGWTDEIAILTVPVVANGEYEITVVYDGAKITVTVSDGTNTETQETTPSATLYNNSANKIAFGGIAKNASLSARYVSFDLDDTYIENEGSLVWGVKS